MNGCTNIYSLVVTLNEPIKYLYFLHVCAKNFLATGQWPKAWQLQERNVSFRRRLRELVAYHTFVPRALRLPGQWIVARNYIFNNTYLRSFDGYRCRWPPSCMWLLRRFSLRLLGLLLLLHQCGWWRIKCTFPLHGHTIHLGTKIRHC